MPLKVFVITINHIMPIIHLKLTGFNNIMSFGEMLTYLLIAYHLDEETRWEEIKEDIVNVVLYPKSTMGMNDPLAEYNWAVTTTDHLVTLLQEAYDLLLPYLELHIPCFETEGYVFTKLTCNLSGLVLYYSRQDIF